MEQEKLIWQIKVVFTEIQRRASDPAFKFDNGGAMKRALVGFLQRAEKQFGSVSPRRLVDMCVFISYRHRNSKTGVKAMFGPTGFHKYLESVNGSRYYENRWLEEIGTGRASLTAMISDREEHPHRKYIYMPSEEPTKRRMLNKRVGYLLCQSSTLGWSPLSESCCQCDFKSDCMKETSQKYPEIYRLRVENGSTDIQ